MHLRRVNHRLQRLRGEFRAHELSQLHRCNSAESADGKEEHRLWTFQIEGMVGAGLQCGGVWVYGCLVCDLLFPVRVADE